MKPRMEVTRRALDQVRADAWVLFLSEKERKIDGAPAALHDRLAAEVLRCKFRGSRGEVLTVPLSGVNGVSAALIAGLGPRDQYGPEILRLGAAAAVREAQKLHSARVAAALPAAGGADFGPTERALAVAEGLWLGLYSFDRFITEEHRRAHRPQELVLAAGRHAALAARALKRAEALVDSAMLVRDMVNMPAGRLDPETMAAEIQRAVKGTRIAIETLGPRELQRERMEALLAVARGSDKPPRLVHLKYAPAGRPRARLAFVGKGVTFDAGGYNLKSGEHMVGMKADMSGAAAVFGAVLTLARLRAPVEVHGVLGLVENLVSGRAYKPGDVLVSRSGKTIEITNTDAEGRLVLADALDYAQSTVKAEALVDVATLTGACVVALGPSCSGLFANDDRLAQRLLTAARRAGEKMWRLPLVPEYEDDIKSELADLRNTGKRWGGAIAGGLFLKKFVAKGVPWAHLDIAGPAHLEDDHPFWGRGGTAAGLATLVEFALAR